MYQFIKNQWILRKFTAEQLNASVAKGYITMDQAVEIMNTPQIPE